MGEWGKVSSEVQGQSPWSGEQGATPPHEAESFLAFGSSLKPANLPT